MIASEPASAASPDAAAAAKTEEPTPVYSRLRSRESRTPRPLREEKGTEARRRIPEYGESERGLDREQEIGIRNLAVSAADTIARSDFPFASFSLLRRGRGAYPIPLSSRVEERPRRPFAGPICQLVCGKRMPSSCLFWTSNEITL
jgi:hypothetical protein